MYILTYKYDGFRSLRDYKGKRCYTISVENGFRTFATLECMNYFLDMATDFKEKYRDIRFYEIKEELVPAVNPAESRWKRLKI